MKSRGRNLHWADIEMSQLDLRKLNNHFGQSNKAEGKSPKTISWYGEMLHDFVRYLEKTGHGPILSSLDMLSVREFIVHEQGRGLSPYSVQGKTRALKAFSSWLCNEGYTRENILLTLKVPKAPVYLIEPLAYGYRQPQYRHIGSPTG
jgi:site-specific recombinase XerD